MAAIINLLLTKLPESRFQRKGNFASQPAISVSNLQMNTATRQLTKISPFLPAGMVLAAMTQRMHPLPYHTHEFELVFPLGSNTMHLVHNLLKSQASRCEQTGTLTVWSEKEADSSGCPCDSALKIQKSYKQSSIV
jgi:hypothetical protein